MTDMTVSHFLFDSSFILYLFFYFPMLIPFLDLWSSWILLFIRFLFFSFLFSSSGLTVFGPNASIRLTPEHQHLKTYSLYCSKSPLPSSIWGL